MTFKKFITFYSIALAVLMACFLGYVTDSLIKYENNQLDNYMKNFIEDLKDVDVDFRIEGLSEVKKGAFDKADASVLNGIAYLAENDSLTYQQSMEGKDADNPVFDVFDGDDPIMRVTLVKKASTTRLGLLSFNIWDLKEVKLLKKEGLFNCEITVPVKYNVEVNGKTLTQKEYADTVMYAGLAEIAKQTDLSLQVKYLVKGLTDAPEVKITDKGGQPKELSGKGSKFVVEVSCENVAEISAAKSKLKNLPDIQELARSWSLFMSNDLKGEKNGFQTLREYLIEGTNLYQYAYNWATGADIKFTSKHGFADPMFSNEKVCNFKIYSDKEFSCDVFLQKNMLVHGSPLPDKMGERMHFVYYDSTDDGVSNPSWKLVSMKSITAK